jgi:hypothetical protein
MGDEVRYDSPQTKNGAGARLEPMLDTGDRDDGYYVKRTQAKLDLMRADRRQYDGNWDRHRRYYGGDHWFNKQRPSYKARPAPNYVFADIETIIPIMTDSRPAINILAKEEKYASSADLMQDAVRAVFAKNKMATREVYVLKDAHIYGTGITKQSYDPKAKCIRISSVDTRHFFMAPGHTEFETTPYCGIARNRFVSDMESDFPHLKGRIGKGVGVVDESLTHKPVEPNKLYEQDKAFVINADTGEMMNASDSGSEDPARQIATEIELWERDQKGQVWLTIVCGDQLARRSKSPYKNGLPSNPGGSKYPFAKCLCYPINSQFWGMSEVANLESPQDMVNRSEAQIADLGRLCTSPYMRIHRRSRVSLKDITNRIASFIVWDGDVPPDWMPPPGVASELFRIVENSKSHMDNMSSVHEASRGELPSDRISGVALKTLQKATTGRVALKTRMFEEYLIEVAGQVVDLAKQYYHNTTIRVGRKYRKINVQDPKTGAVDPKTDVSNADYEIEIGVGSTLPVDKGVRFEQASQLFVNGAISRKTFLKRTGWTEDEVQKALEELKQEKLEDAQQQIQLEALSAAEQAASAPEAMGVAPAAPGGAGAPAPAPPGPQAPAAGGGDEVDGLMNEISELEGAA